jgi:hypothetical protein
VREGQFGCRRDSGAPQRRQVSLGLATAMSDAQTMLGLELVPLSANRPHAAAVTWQAMPCIEQQEGTCNLQGAQKGLPWSQ